MTASNEQIHALAIPLVSKMDAMLDFFKDPQNEQAYRDWYYKRYGKYPNDEVK